MQVSHESIYTYLYIHARGTLKNQLVRELRQAMPKRGKTPATTDRKEQFVDMVSIHDRDPKIDCHLVPGNGAPMRIQTDYSDSISRKEPILDKYRIG
jgi:transposase, IS30 family